MRTVIFFMMVVLLGGCSSTKQPSRETIRTVKDSTWTETTFHKKDTTIFIPGDTLRVKIPFNEISTTPVQRSNGRSTAIVTRVGDDLDIQCITDALEQKLELLEKYVKENSVKENTIEIRTEVEVPYTPFITKLFSYIGMLASLVFVGFLGIKFLKPF